VEFSYTGDGPVTADRRLENVRIVYCATHEAAFRLADALEEWLISVDRGWIAMDRDLMSHLATPARTLLRELGR